MNARQLIALQVISLMAIIATIGTLFENRTSTIIFATALFIFARCSVYISTHSARLLRELEREKELYKAKK
jgi:hypothetical protein